MSRLKELMKEVTANSMVKTGEYSKHIEFSVRKIWYILEIKYHEYKNMRAEMNVPESMNLIIQDDAYNIILDKNYNKEDTEMGVWLDILEGMGAYEFYK